MKSLVSLVLVGALLFPSAAASASGPLERSVATHAARAAAAMTQTAEPRAAGNAVALRWDELGPVVAGRRITAVLTDGSRITGDAVVVREDALVMDVKRSTGSRTYAGNAPVPRSAVALLEIERQEGAGRALGIVLGVLAGVVIGGWVSAEVADSAGTGIPVFLGVASGLTLAGAYAGKSMSRRVTVIRIVS